MVLNTLNEKDLLPRVIGSVVDLADEIVVVDMESTDGTADTAKKLGAKVFTHKKLSFVEPARNFAVNKASGDWILVLDADEEIPQNLAKLIRKLITAGNADYFRIARKNMIFGRYMRHSRWWPDYNVRLFKKGMVTWSDVIHREPKVKGKGIDIEAREDLAILHHTYDSVEKYLEHLNRYTSVQADLKVKSGYKFSWRDMLLRPSNEFLSRYFSDRGYKDGAWGLALSLLQGFSELIFYLKIWQAEKFSMQKMELGEVVAEMRARERDLHYWQGDSLYKETGRLKDRIIRKLRI